ncbi:hypothetical protein VTN00DRAFT_355 [Thermoascus crustaceus]|uniref:uncharacterized protein n=1 Tax=Thermoascus crustaceus TaxID=5088 RepID=UPI00374488C9
MGCGGRERELVPAVAPQTAGSHTYGRSRTAALPIILLLPSDLSSPRRLLFLRCRSRYSTNKVSADPWMLAGLLAPPDPRRRGAAYSHHNKVPTDHQAFPDAYQAAGGRGRGCEHKRHKCITQLSANHSSRSARPMTHGQSRRV